MIIERVGVDESGKGDFFGPLVVAACYVGPTEEAQLNGVQDSKKLTDAKAISLSIKIKSVCPYALVVIGPAKYNELYDKFKNLNHLLAWAHARAIENILEKKDCSYVISDQFADPTRLKKSLFEKGRQIVLESRVRAEDDLAVAAASVLARAEFLNRLKQLGTKYNMELPKGASSKVIESGQKFFQANGTTGLKEVAKLHFKTTQAVIN